MAGLYERLTRALALRGEHLEGLHDFVGVADADRALLQESLRSVSTGSRKQRSRMKSIRPLLERGARLDDGAGHVARFDDHGAACERGHGVTFRSYRELRRARLLVIRESAGKAPQRCSLLRRHATRRGGRAPFGVRVAPRSPRRPAPPVQGHPIRDPVSRLRELSVPLPLRDRLRLHAGSAAST